MIGQNRLKSLISSFDFNSFPDVILLVGEEGSGKKTLINDVIKEQFKLDVKDITDDVSYEGIGAIYLAPAPFIYTIDADKLSEKKYNVLLKFLEEPPLNCRIILTTSNISKIVQSVLSRCQIWYLDNYSTDELLNFTKDTSLIKYIKTPGKLIQCKHIDDIVELSRDILLKNKQVTLGGLLSVSSRIKWTKLDDNKIDISIFCNVLIHEALDCFKNKRLSASQYTLVNQFVNSNDINKDLFESFLVRLKLDEH